MDWRLLIKKVGAAKNKPISFWVVLFFLNVMLFLPDYFLAGNTSLSGPVVRFFKLDSFAEMISYFFSRSLHDPWRISVDFIVVIFLFSLAKKKKLAREWVLVTLIVLFYVTLFFNQIYESSIRNLFNRSPEFFNDYFLLQNSFHIVLNDIRWIFLVTISTVLTLTLITWMIRLLVRHIKFAEFFRHPVTIGLLAISVVAIYIVGPASYPNTFPILSARLAGNLIRSGQAVKYREADYLKIKDANEVYLNYKLQDKPNVLLIFIESYGRIVFDSDEVRPAYLSKIDSVQEELSLNGFYATSNLSIPPVSGGSSWMSYSSFLYGYNFRYNSFYRYLVHHPEIESCINFYRWLKFNGYSGYFISPFEPRNYYVPVEEYKKYYALPHWIRYDHFRDYDGHRYGWNDPPPDQYTLNYSYEYARNSSSEPVTLFYLTKNSHYNFESPHKAVEDWRTLKIKVDQKPTHEGVSLESYGKAINYQLDYLQDFMIKQNTGRDIFVLMGDHQPPTLPGDEAGFETPVHVISQESAFLEPFSEYGFVAGLRLSGEKEPIRHEAMLSILIREMVRTYGSDTVSLPQYLPEGIK